MKVYAVAWRNEGQGGWNWMRLNDAGPQPDLLALFYTRGEAEGVAAAAAAALMNQWRVHEIEFPELSERGSLLVAGRLADSWTPTSQEHPGGEVR